MIQAEEKFRQFVKTNFPKVRVTKKGLPDFMVVKDDKVIGFIEVKRVSLLKSEQLRPEQKMFRDFCNKNNIPYQVWTPNMARDNWLNGSERHRKIWREGVDVLELVAK